jgi:hypothetical protein
MTATGMLRRFFVKMNPLDLYSTVTLSVRIFIEVASVWFLSRCLGLPFRLKNPFVLAWVFTAPIFLLRLLVGPSVLIAEGLKDPFFLKAVWIETVTMCVITVYSVCLILLGQKSILQLMPPLENRDKAVSRSRLTWLGYAFMGVGFIAVIIMASREYGVVNWIINPRTGYQYHRDGQGHWYALAVNCLAVSSALLALLARSGGQFFLSSLPVFFLAYLLGSKGFFLNTAIFFAIAMNIRKMREAKFIQPILIGTAAIVMLANYAQAGASIDFQSVAKYFDYFPNAAKALAMFDSGALPLFEGKILTSNFWSAVPRGFFADKPYVYGVLHLNEVMWPGLTKLGHTPAFSAGIDNYADFGWYGVLLAPFLSFYSPLYVVTAVLVAGICRRSCDQVPSIPGVLSLMIAFAPGFMVYLATPWNMFWILFLILMFIIIRPVRSTRTVCR